MGNNSYYEEEEQGFIQPIWSATSNRRTAAIVAWVGMLVMFVAAFALPIVRFGGSGILGGLVDAALSFTDIDGVISVTLFGACQTNLVLMILFIVALVVGLLLPLLTETPFEVIPCGFMIGLYAYVGTHKVAILCKVNNPDLLGEELQTEIQTWVEEIAEMVSSVGVGLKFGAGFYVGILGLIIMIVAIILHFVLKPKSRKASKGTAKTDDYYSSFVPGADKNTQSAAGTAQSYSADGYSGNPYGETGVLSGNAAGTQESASNPTVVLNQQAGRLVRLNTNETAVVNEGEMILGRDASRASFVVRNDSVSGVHAKIITTNGVCSVVDLHSTNGTYVNDQKLVPDIKVNLRDGDYISLGAEILQFHQG